MTIGKEIIESTRDMIGRLLMQYVREIDKAYMQIEEEELRDIQAVENAIDVSANKGKVLSIAKENMEPDEIEAGTPSEEKQPQVEQEKEKPAEEKKQEAKRGPSF